MAAMLSLSRGRFVEPDPVTWCATSKSVDGKAAVHFDVTAIPMVRGGTGLGYNAGLFITHNQANLDLPYIHTDVDTRENSARKIEINEYILIRSEQYVWLFI